MAGVDNRIRPVPAGWAEELAAWRTTLKAEGLSPGTVRTRCEHVERLARVAGGVPGDVSGEWLLGWVAGQSWAPETRRSHYASFRRFYGWRVRSGRGTTSPAGELPKVAPDPPAPRPAPEHSYRLALRDAGARERLMLRLGAEAGLRRAEIAQVHGRDLVDDMLGVSLVVHGKGRRRRVVPLSGSLASELVAWIAGQGGGHAFPGGVEGHLSARHVGKLMAALLPGDLTAHTLRHRFASRAYAVDHDIVTTSKLLGHASIATTQRYVAVLDEAGRALVEAIA